MLNKRIIFVTSTRADFGKLKSSSEFLSIFFTIICFLVLINGSNFLDGLNSLVIFYYILQKRNVLNKKARQFCFGYIYKYLYIYMLVYIHVYIYIYNNI